MAKKNMTLEEKLNEAIVKDAPYEVPGNWVWTKFGIIVEINPKKVYVKELDDTVDCSFIPMNIVDNELGVIHESEIRNLGEVKRGYTNFIEGDVIFAKITPCMENRKSAIVPKLKNDLGYGSTEFHVFRANSRYIYNKYIFYFIRSHEFISDATSSMTGAVGQQRVPKSFIEEYKIPIPPLKEQQRIVDRIESLFEKLNKAKELIGEAREEFGKRKAAVLEKAFRGELTEELLKLNNCKKNDFITGISEHEELYVSKLPYNWSVCRINDIANVKGGKRLPKGESLVKENTGYPYLKAGNLKDGSVLEDDIEYLSKEVMNKINNYTISSDDVYITIVGACIGDVGIIPKHLTGANLTENAAKICDINGELIDKIFLMKWLSSLTGQYFIKGNILSATLGKLALTRIKEILLPLPPLEEQKEIVKILDKLLEDESKIEELTQLEDQIELIKKSILAKAFRGELGTNCEEDESALELLKEILNKQ